MSSLIEVKVPDIDDFKEVAVIEVLVKPGDTVQAEQSLVAANAQIASAASVTALAAAVRQVAAPKTTALAADRWTQTCLVVA